MSALLVVTAPAQTGSGTIRGLITDPSSGAVPNCAVTALTGQDVIRIALSDSGGRYQLSGIAPGTYTIRADASGFADYDNLVYELVAGSTQVLDIAPTLCGQAEQITVGWIAP
jgi:hypothetical protein